MDDGRGSRTTRRDAAVVVGAGAVVLSIPLFFFAYILSEHPSGGDPISALLLFGTALCSLVVGILLVVGRYPLVAAALVLAGVMCFLLLSVT